MENMDWQTFGHEKVKKILSLQLNKNQFFHSYLFFGEQGLGKKKLAEEFAKKILKTENLLTHPDFFILKSNTENSEITIDLTRKFMSDFSETPFASKNKVGLIDNAENLNLVSQNALLKTLEEPPANSVLILLASRKLLPTIISRMQTFYFYSFSINKLKNFAESLNKKPTIEYLNFSFGLPGRLLNFFTDKEFFEKEKNICLSYENLQKFSEAEKLLQINSYADMENEQIFKLLESWLRWEFFSSTKKVKDITKLNVLCESILNLKANLNKKFIFQNLFFKI